MTNLRRARRLILLCCISTATLAAGCAKSSPALPTPEQGGVRKAALARLTIENRTTEHLSIAFRPVGGPGAEIVIGGVGPGTSTELAPILAGEPVILVARTDDGAEFRLQPRTFAADEGWTWVIPGDADFIRVSGDGK